MNSARPRATVPNDKITTLLIFWYAPFLCSGAHLSHILRANNVCVVIWMCVLVHAANANFTINYAWKTWHRLHAMLHLATAVFLGGGNKSTSFKASFMNLLMTSRDFTIHCKTYNISKVKHMYSNICVLNKYRTRTSIFRIPISIWLDNAVCAGACSTCVCVWCDCVSR